MNVIITGPKHCGKSTAVSKVINAFNGKISGFITEFENRESNTRRLTLRSVDSSKRCFAAIWNGETCEVFPDAFNTVGAALIDTNCDLLVIDELGKFEKNCNKLEKAVSDAFSSPTNVLVSIRLDAEGWMQALKKRDDVVVFYISDENRDKLPYELLKLFEQ